MRKGFLISLIVLCFISAIISHVFAASVTVIKDGITQTYTDSNEPLIDKSIVYFPLSGLSDILGLRADYDSQNQEVIINQRLLLKTDSNIAYLDDSAINNAPPIKINDNIAYVPIEFISKIAGYSCDYNESTMILTLSKLPLSIQGTVVSGSIDSDTVWTISGSPYLISGDLVINPNARLTIQDGVQVFITGNYSIQIKGKLLIKGDPSSTVKFSGVDLGTWKGICLEGANNIIKNCNTYGDMNFECNSDSNNLTDSKFGSFEQVGNNNIIIGCSLSQTSIGGNNNVLSYCNIRNGLTITSGQGNTISNCGISKGETGINVLSGKGLIIKECDILQNSCGISINNDYDQINISNCNINSNSSYNIRCGVGEGALNAQNNYWGVIDKSEIEATMFDNLDDSSLTKISFEPFLTTPYGSDLAMPSKHSGTYESSINIELNVALGGYEILYTIDGSDPTQSGILYTSAILLNSNTELKTVTRKDSVFSEVKSYTYSIIYPVQGLTMSQSFARVIKGQTYTPVPEFTPENATDKSLTWLSSDEDIATVDSNGVITGISNGIANITTTTVDGIFTSSIKVVVASIGEPEYIIEQVSPALGDSIKANDNNTVQLKLTNWGMDSNPITLFYAIYDIDNNLIDVGSTSLTINAGQTSEVPLTINIPIDAKKVKFFIWDSLSFPKSKSTIIAVN